MIFPRRYDATTSRADFVRLLPAATGEPDYREIGDSFVGRGWRVQLEAISPLKIGMVRLERHRIEISFDGISHEQQDKFMRRFTLHYQRGGG
jgi:hypothetical protein